MRTTSMSGPSPVALSIATPATLQPDAPSDASTRRRHMPMKRARTSAGVRFVPACRYASTRLDVRRMASCALRLSVGEMMIDRPARRAAFFEHVQEDVVLAAAANVSASPK